jgi:hypothetical protein
MKADLNKILAALQQLEQNPNVSKSHPATSNLDSSVGITSETSKAVQPDASVPIPPLQPNSQAPTLPIFDSSSAEKPPAAEEPSLVEISPPTLIQDLQQIIQQIESLYREGPIVDGWLESYACESTPSNDNTVDMATPLEYVKAAGSLQQDKVICEAPRSCYRLNGVSSTGQQWSYPCPIEQLPSVSLAIARYEKLLQLLDRKHDLETRLKSL